jgi:hypothetical protein
MITPTIGRIVWFWNSPELRGAQPEAAIVAKVWSDTMVNLGVFRDNGNCTGFTSVTLWQGEGEPPASAYCEWMPYQKGQAAKTDALELAAAARAAGPTNY